MRSWKWAAATAAAMFLPRYNKTTDGAGFDTPLCELRRKYRPVSRDYHDAANAAFE